jgi:hypothetical protein
MTRSIQQLPNNSSTANDITVASTTGFNAGDYIYNQSGNFAAIPDNAASSGTFNITGTNLSNYGNGMSGGIAGIWNNLGQSKYQKMSAVLTNGNVVTVSTNPNNNYPKFKIDTPANVSVVAQTNISTTYTCNYDNIGVIALSGGGFVVYWNNAAGGTLNVPTYAIYSNTGSVVTSATQDTSFSVMPTTASVMNATALPNGGFVLASISTTPTAQYRIYTSTGTGAYSTTSLGSSVQNYAHIGISARSDNSFCISYRATATTQAYTIVSATNTSIVSLTTFVVAGSGTSSSATTLSNDTFVIGYINGNNPCFRLLPTGNTLGSENVVAFSTNYLTGTVAGSITVFGLSAGNFVFAFIDNFSVIQYAFYSNTGTLVSATQLMPSAYFDTVSNAGLSLIELTSNVNIYYPNGSGSTSGYTTSYFSISKSTYAILNLGTGITQIISTASVSVSGYARSASTPSGASFFAATTQTLTSTTAQTSGTLTSNTITTTASQTIHSCPLLNGTGFAVAVCTTASPTVSIYIYNILAVLQKTIVTSLTSGYYGLKIALMSSGNLVVVGGDNSSAYIAIYNPTTGARLATGTVTNVNTIGSSANYTWGLTGISNDRFAFYCNDSSTAFGKLIVFSNTITQLYTTTSAGSGGSAYLCNLASTLNSDGFWASDFDSNSGYPVYSYIQNTSGNSFTVNGPYINYAGLTAQINTNGCAVTSNNIFSFIGGQSSTVYATISSANTIYKTTNTTDSNSLTYNCRALAATSYGAFAQISLQINSTNATGYLYVFGAGANAIQSSFIGISTATSPYPTLSPLYDGSMALAWLDNNNLPRIALINAGAFSYSANLTAGVTASNTAINPTPTNGYTLAGVSITSAPAGGTGLVQNNGVAKLNSNYNASQSAVSFDSTNPVTLGVKGIVTGLNVNMQGN